MPGAEILHSYIQPVRQMDGGEEGEGMWDHPQQEKRIRRRTKLN